MGVQDDIIGYEGNTDGANPNYTRSIAWNLEPATLLGLVGSYQVSSLITVQAGIADATSGATTTSAKTYVGSIALTAPDSWGFLKGGTANLGIVANPDKTGQFNYYAGFTIPTPVNILKVGGAFDLVSVNNSSASGAGNNQNDSGWVLGGYANVQATDKLALNVRGEVYDLKGGVPNTPGPVSGIYAFGNSQNGVGEELTATVQYNLWANVISRVEARWDHEDASPYTFATNKAQDSFILALNVIYTF